MTEINPQDIIDIADYQQTEDSIKITCLTLENTIELEVGKKIVKAWAEHDNILSKDFINPYTDEMDNGTMNFYDWWEARDIDFDDIFNLAKFAVKYYSKETIKTVI